MINTKNILILLISLTIIVSISGLSIFTVSYISYLEEKKDYLKDIKNANKMFSNKTNQFTPHENNFSGGDKNNLTKSFDIITNTGRAGRSLGGGSAGNSGSGSGGGGGGGAPIEEILICTPEELDAIRTNLVGHYKQVCDIDLASYGVWTPIGNETNPNNVFRGTYNGNGYKIYNLTLNSSNMAISNGWGLFGVAERADFFNINLINVKINLSRGSVGSIVGIAKSSTIRSAIIEGTIEAQFGVGGLVGIIIPSSDTGINKGSKIIESSFRGNVSGIGDVGGLVGRAWDEPIINLITSSSVEGEIKGFGNTGGLAGMWTGIIRDSYVSGEVHSINKNVGGATSFFIERTGYIDNFNFIGEMSGNGSVGGVVGTIISSQINIPPINNNKIISNSFSVVNISASPNLACPECIDVGIGGLVGNVRCSTGASEECLSLPRRSIFRSYSISNILLNNYPQSDVGGLVGNINFVRNNLRFFTPLEISESFVYTNITSFNSSSVGGLIGRIGGGNVLIKDNYARGEIIGKEFVGGLIGRIGGGNVLIKDNYARGEIIGKEFVGGLIGIINETQVSIINNYASTSIVNISYPGGGLIGENYGGAIGSSYWDINVSGTSTSAGGEGRTTEEMITQNNYVGWNFNNIWAMLSGEYPKLQWEFGICGPLGCSPQKEPPIFFTRKLKIIIGIHLFLLLGLIIGIIFTLIYSYKRSEKIKEQFISSIKTKNNIIPVVKKANPKIIWYLEEGQRRGFDISQLKQKLVENGFSSEDVDASIKELYKLYQFKYDK